MSAQVDLGCVTTEGRAPFVVDGETHHTWYRVFGDLQNSTQVPVVAIHGGPGFSHDYILPISDIANPKVTSAPIPIIFYDQIGSSRSGTTETRAKPVTFWNIDLFLDELTNLLNHLGISKKFDLNGHSWGATVAMEYVVRRKPEGLRRLILSNPYASIPLWNESVNKLMAAFPKDVQEDVAAGLAEPKRYLPALSRFHKIHQCTIVPRPLEYSASMDLVFKEGGDLSVAMGMFPPGRELFDWTIVDRLHLINVPTLVINGRQDISQDFVVAPLFRSIPKVKWITFDKSSHSPMWEERALYNKTVKEFLTTDV